MGVMNYLRERMGKIVAIVIGLSLFAFILGEVLRSGGSFFKSDRDAVGEVDGEKISNVEFAKLLEQATAQFKQQSGQASLSPQFTSMIQENTWSQKVNQIILNKEVDKLGLTVSADEQADMVNGNNPDPQILQYFGDPKTGKLDVTKLNNFKAQLKTLKADDQTKVQWEAFIEQLAVNKLAQKYIALSSNGLYINSLDAKEEYESKNKLVNFKYVTLDYASIPDNKITLTDADYQSYFDEHKNEFKTKQELRSFDYVSFNASPSKDDSAAVKDLVEKLVPTFKSTTNDSLFVQQNADSKAVFLYKKKGQLGDPKLDSIMFNEPKGFVYGPYLSNGSYKIAKLVEIKATFDSVKTKHILIKPGVGGLPNALAKADSIKKLVQGGRSFNDMVTMFSEDPGSAKQGGEIPAFDFNGMMAAGQGSIAPEYVKAAFNGKKGELVIATSQFGVHLIQIEDQKGSSTVAKVATVDKAITPSTKTQTIAYNKAQAFLGTLSKGNFDAAAKKAGLVKKTATDAQVLAAALPGVDDARQVVRWAFKAEVGDFGDQVYVVGEQYIIPVLTQIKPKGIPPLDQVKKQIESQVRNHVKATQLIEKMQAAVTGASTIDQVAKKVHATVMPVQNVVLANPVIPGVSAEYTVVGTMFGSKPNKLSKPIEGTHGVYVFVVDNFINPAALTNATTEKQQIAQSMLQRSQGAIFDALKDKANVKDNRSNFY